MSAREDLGIYLRACRRSAGSRQIDAATALGVDASQISRWENGRQLPLQSRAKDLARVYGADLEEMRAKIGAAWEEDADERAHAVDVMVETVNRSLSAMVPLLEEILKEVRRRPSR